MVSIYMLLNNTNISLMWQTSVSVVALRNGMFSTLAHVSDKNLGGRDIDIAIVDLLAQEFKRYGTPRYTHVCVCVRVCVCLSVSACC